MAASCIRTPGRRDDQQRPPTSGCCRRHLHWLNLVSLERRTARSGKDSIDHAPGAHDDIANSVAGCLTGIVGKGAYDIRALARGMGELVGMMTGSVMHGGGNSPKLRSSDRPYLGQDSGSGHF